MLAIALGLGSALAWGLADFVGGIQSRRHAVLAVLVISQVVGTLSLAVVVLAVGGALPTGAAAAWVVGGSIGGIAGLLAFYAALAGGTMSVVAPISASGVAIPVLAGVLLGERPGAIQWAGLALAVAGIVLASREPPSADAPRAAAQRRAVLLALVAAVGIGVFLLGIDRATESADPLPTTLLGRLSSSTLALVALAVVRPSLPGRGALPAVAAVGLLDAGANALYALATTEGLLTVVSVLGSLYPAITVVLAHLLLGERISVGQRAGVATVFAGVVLIAAG